MTNRSESGAEFKGIPSDIIYLKSQEVIPSLKRLYPDKIEEISDLNLMLNLYVQGDLAIYYQRSAQKEINGVRVKMTTVTLSHKSEDLKERLSLLNFHSRIWGEDPETLARIISQERNSADVRDSGFFLQVNTIRYSLISPKPIHRTGIDFRRSFGGKMSVQSLLFNGDQPERKDLGLQLSARELLTMESEVLIMAQRPKGSPALQARTTS